MAQVKSKREGTPVDLIENGAHPRFTRLESSKRAIAGLPALKLAETP